MEGELHPTTVVEEADLHMDNGFNEFIQSTRGRGNVVSSIAACWLRYHPLIFCLLGTAFRLERDAFRRVNLLLLRGATQ